MEAFLTSNPRLALKKELKRFYRAGILKNL
jgi:hypothetical protein